MLRHCVGAGFTLAALLTSPAALFAAGEEAQSTKPIVAEKAPTAEALKQGANAAPSPKIWEAAKSGLVATPAPSPKIWEAAKTAVMANAAENAKSSVEPVKTAAAPKVEEAAKPVVAEPSLKVTIDLGSQNMTVSERGSVTYSWPISSGTSEHPTPRGTFHPQWTAKMWYSTKYDNAPMPNAVFINGGVAIHATYATRMLGRPASHGCIRLAPANAAIFYKLVHQHGLGMTRVSVYGTPKWGSPAIASRRSADAPRYASNDDRVYRKPSYGSTSAFDWFFGKPAKAKPPVVYYPGDRPRYVYRDPRPARYVYDRPRRSYYVNSW